MSANKDAVLAAARASLGITENPSGSNVQKFSTYWHHPPEPWCADAACYWLMMGGALDVPMSAYTPTLYGYYASKGRASSTPRSGSLVFFNWNDGGDRIDHVGLVESVRSDGSIITIEGNVSNMVARHVRRSNIAGFGHPIYGAVNTSPATHSNPTFSGLKAPGFPLPSGYYFGPKSGPTESVSGYYGYRGALGIWQNRMHDRGWTIDADGYYGPNTENVSRKFQAEKGLGADGRIGPLTWSAAWTSPVN